ncbi:MAG: EAL domain-containing protein [Erythrobacter sp.]
MKDVYDETEFDTDRFGNADRDLVALGVALSAILLFVGTGGTVFPRAVAALLGQSEPPDHLLVNALLLNVVLIIFGWRRYRELKGEIAERRRAEQQARRLAEIDPLTGCLNRRSMNRASERVRAHANAQRKALAYCMIDLDNFKKINDLHGHALGDAVLVELAGRIQSRLPEGAHLARLGGDEFGFILTFDPENRAMIDDLIVRLYEQVSKPFENDGTHVDASISIGVACDHDEHGFNPDAGDIGVLMQQADIAMYHAKKQGKNRYFWFEPSMENDLRYRNEIEIGIRNGLTTDEFVPYYEQQVDIETGELVGFEMLARWHSPKLGVVSPEIFIPIAEEIGVIGELAEQLLRKALVDASEWPDHLTLAINVSPVQMRDPWFAQKLLKLLVEHRFPAARLEIEITESCLHENIGLVRSLIASLRNQGVQVSIDDFGTGYSSLEQLRTLPFDRIKIDRNFVGELNNPNNKSQIVDAIVSLGRGLDLPITAEGIEDEAILTSLKRLGKLKGQGYLYGRPETAEQVRERLGTKGSSRNRKDAQPDDVATLKPKIAAQ